MMYVVKVGDYYVRAVELTGGAVGDIVLSNELMRNFTKPMAETIAKKINGEVVEFREEVSNSE